MFLAFSIRFIPVASILTIPIKGITDVKNFHYEPLT